MDWSLPSSTVSNRIKNTNFKFWICAQRRVEASQLDQCCNKHSGPKGAELLVILHFQCSDILEMRDGNAVLNWSVISDHRFIVRCKLPYYIRFLAGPCDNWVMESSCFYKPCRGWSCKSYSSSLWIVIFIVDCHHYLPLWIAKRWKVHKTGFNHYSTECLIKAGGREEGVMDFVQYVKSSSTVFNTNTYINANIYCIFNINQRSCTNWISTANTPFLLVATSNEFCLFLLVVNTTVYYHRFYKYIHTLQLFQET